MRIVATFENLLPASAADAEVFLNTAAALARQPGVDLQLLIPRNPASSVDEVRRYFGLTGPLEITEVPSLRAGLPLQHLTHALRSARRAQLADLVYTRNMATLAAALHAGEHVAFDHYRPWGDQVPPLQPLLRHLLGHPRCLGAVIHSEYARRSYRRLGVPEARLRVAHNGWNPSRMEPVLDQADARRRAGLPDDRFIVAYTGRINRRKGLDAVLAIARACPEMLFVLVGSEGEGPIERAARTIPNVRVEPFKPFDEAAPFLYAADVLIVPPSTTPLLQHGHTVLPLKLFLYLAAGRAILGPASPDVGEILRSGQNALLVRPGDIAGAAAALRRLRDDGPLRERLGAAARREAADCTWDARAARIRAFLEERLAAARGGSPEPLGPWHARRWLVESGRWAGWVATHGGFTIPTAPVLDRPPTGSGSLGPV